MTADFHEIQFPTDISYGSIGGPEFSTEVIITASGLERRNQNWEYERERWNVGYGINTVAKLTALIRFFRARKGRAIGFRFKNHDDYTATGEPLQAITSTSVGDDYQFVKRYTDAGGTYIKKITKLVSTTVTVYEDSITLTESVDYTLDYATGILTLLNPSATTGTLTADFEFDLPVRFDSDYLPRNFETFEARSAEVPVVELFL